MECSCVYVGDYDEPDIASEKYQTSRKIHICCECKRRIQIGEKYEYVSGKWDGVFDSYKTCSDCISIRASFFCEGWRFTSLYDDLGDHIHDVGCDISESCIAGLNTKAREVVCELIDRCWANTYDDDE